MAWANNKHYLFLFYDKNSDKFLTYYDEDWDCYFIINGKLGLDKDYYSLFPLVFEFLKDININTGRLKNISHLKTISFSKYCVPEKREKKYTHSYYQVLINNFSEKETGTYFGRKGVKYKWMTLEEMFSDEVVYKKNLDVLNHINIIINEDRFVE